MNYPAPSLLSAVNSANVQSKPANGPISNPHFKRLLLWANGLSPLVPALRNKRRWLHSFNAMYQYVRQLI